jgi:hypothetical protein
MNYTDITAHLKIARNAAYSISITQDAHRGALLYASRGFSRNVVFSSYKNHVSKIYSALSYETKRSDKLVMMIQVVFSLEIEVKIVGFYVNIWESLLDQQLSQHPHTFFWNRNG